jgi:hypothetical protein
MCATDEGQIAQDILSYLSGHATAQDTFDGIVEWWLLEQKIDRQTRQVQQVLDDLVAKRLLSARTASDSRIHYRINKRKAREISLLLQAQR